MSQSIATMKNDMFFEGVEKLLEVWFIRKDGNSSNCDLRKIPRCKLEMILQMVKCEIISSVSSEDLDAYVLSESSMFISKRRFILKTCGRTTPLLCLSLLMSLAKDVAGFDAVQDLFYSRKNFKRPELQETPYRNFEEEAALLDDLFPTKGGRAYCLGTLNGSDCWYLYALSSPLNRKLSNKENVRKSITQRKSHPSFESDQTLEILMTQLDPEKLEIFYKKNGFSAQEATKKSGISKFISNMVIDDFLFEPCGYSMNGVSKDVPGGYMTIHITPEPDFSYVSFETNIPPEKSYEDLVQRVIEAFGPKHFVLTLFTTEPFLHTIFGESDMTIPQYSDYNVEDVQVSRLPGYDLTYALYNRLPS